jgi:hypothetical protein
MAAGLSIVAAVFFASFQSFGVVPGDWMQEMASFADRDQP